MAQVQQGGIPVVVVEGHHVLIQAALGVAVSHIIPFSTPRTKVDVVIEAVIGIFRRFIASRDLQHILEMADGGVRRVNGPADLPFTHGIRLHAVIPMTVWEEVHTLADQTAQFRDAGLIGDIIGDDHCLVPGGAGIPDRHPTGVVVVYFDLGKGVPHEIHFAGLLIDAGTVFDCPPAVPVALPPVIVSCGDGFPATGGRSAVACCSVGRLYAGEDGQHILILQRDGAVICLQIDGCLILVLAVLGHKDRHQTVIRGGKTLPGIEAGLDRFQIFGVAVPVLQAAAHFCVGAIIVDSHKGLEHQIKLCFRTLADRDDIRVHSAIVSNHVLLGKGLPTLGYQRLHISCVKDLARDLRDFGVRFCTGGCIRFAVVRFFGLLWFIASAAACQRSRTHGGSQKQRKNLFHQISSFRDFMFYSESIPALEDCTLARIACTSSSSREIFSFCPLNSSRITASYRVLPASVQRTAILPMTGFP